jgi:hypothetical protein
MKLVKLNTDWKFPNSVYVFKDTKQVDPNSEEGKTITIIHNQQKQTREGNKQQKEKRVSETLSQNSEI